MNNVGLWSSPVADIGDIAHVDRATIGDLDRKTVQLIDRLWRVVKLNIVLKATYLRKAYRVDLRLIGYRSCYVLRRQAAGLQCLGIDIDLYLPLLAPKRKRHRDARYRHQRRAKLVEAKVKQLLFAQALARQCQL